MTTWGKVTAGAMARLARDDAAQARHSNESWNPVNYSSRLRDTFRRRRDVVVAPPSPYVEQLRRRISNWIARIVRGYCHGRPGDASLHGRGLLEQCRTIAEEAKADGGVLRQRTFTAHAN